MAAAKTMLKSMIGVFLADASCRVGFLAVIPRSALLAAWVAIVKAMKHLIPAQLAILAQAVALLIKQEFFALMIWSVPHHGQECTATSVLVLLSAVVVICLLVICAMLNRRRSVSIILILLFVPITNVNRTIFLQDVLNVSLIIY